MGTALITLKLMPTSLEVDLEEVKKDSEVIIEENQGKNTRFEEEPVAFGLKAVLVYFDLDEENELEPIEQALAKIDKISSVKVVDMRRALG